MKWIRDCKDMELKLVWNLELRTSTFKFKALSKQREVREAVGDVMAQQSTEVALSLELTT